MQERVINTHTGKIYVNDEKEIEFLTVGDYGKENNIKADFLGLHKEIHGVVNSKVDLSKKWVATISTQKGCPMNCKFCDVPKFGYHGNVSMENLEYQIRTIIKNENVRETERFNVHFARMGEPTWNHDVLSFSMILKEVVWMCGLKAKTIHPVVSTMLPKVIKILLLSYPSGVISKIQYIMEKRGFNFLLILPMIISGKNCLMVKAFL